MAKKDTQSIEVGGNTMISQTVNVRLKDGTELNVNLNATTFESAAPVDKKVFTSENLSKVQIGEEEHENMVLVSFYPFEGGTRFVLRDQTEAEKREADLKEQLEIANNAVAELTMIVAGMVG